MKVAKKLVIVLMLLSTVFCLGYAQSVNQPSTGTIGRLDKVNTPKTHRAPSNVFIEYKYNGNGFSFLPSVLFRLLEVTVIGVETGEVWGAVVSEVSGYTMETGPLPAGTYNITAFTEAGDEYYGEFVMPE